MTNIIAHTRMCTIAYGNAERIKMQLHKESYTYVIIQYMYTDTTMYVISYVIMHVIKMTIYIYIYIQV